MRRVVMAGVVVVAIAATLHRALLPRVVDADAFYHLKHAWVYRTGGLLQTAFPWTQYSAIRREAADLWYGFHLLLLPFTSGDLVTGMRVAAFAVTVAALLLVYAGFAMLEIRRPLGWMLLFAFVSTDMLFRLLMLRPHPLSLGLFVVLLGCLQPGGEHRSATIVLASTLVAWLHLALAWIPLLILAVTAIAGIVGGHGVRWRNGVAVLGGLAGGVLLRPNPRGAVRLAWIQVVEVARVRAPLRFGVELLPLGWADFVRELAPVSVLLVLAMVLAVRLPLRVRPAAVASLALALFFLVLTFTTARRAAELFVVFAVATVALVWTAWRDADPGRASRAGAALVVVFVGWTAVVMPGRFRGYLGSAAFPDDLEPLGEWLRAHAAPGEIVFNVQWEKFAELFFWDERNYYVNGMDPIFAWDYDQTLYWKHHHLADGGAATTCGAPACTPANAEDTHRVLTDDFHAAYVLVDRLRFPALSAYLAGDPGYERVWEARGGHLVWLPDGRATGVMRGDVLFRVRP